MKKLLFHKFNAEFRDIGSTATITTDGEVIAAEEDIVAEEVAELRPGYVYYLHHDGKDPKHQIVRAGEGGVIKNMLGGQFYLHSIWSFEFPHYKLGLNEPILLMVRDHWPVWASIIKAQMRSLGIAFPPSTSNTVFSAGELENWILNQELILSPLAREFIKAVDTGVIDRIAVLPVRHEEATRSVQVSVELTESGCLTVTNYYTWRGRVDVPLSVIRDGEEEIKDYITDWVNDTVSISDCDFQNDQTGDFNCDETDIEITDYGDISSLLDDDDNIEITDYDIRENE